MIGMRAWTSAAAARGVWLRDGSYVWPWLARRNRVWSYDFVQRRADAGRAFRVLDIPDEYTRECALSWVPRRLASFDVPVGLSGLSLRRGIPPLHPVR